MSFPDCIGHMVASCELQGPMELVDVDFRALFIVDSVLNAMMRITVVNLGQGNLANHVEMLIHVWTWKKWRQCTS